VRPLTRARAAFPRSPSRSPGRVRGRPRRDRRRSGRRGRGCRAVPTGARRPWSTSSPTMGAERDRNHPGGDGRRRPAGGTPRRPGGIDRVAGPGRVEHRELGGLGLAQHDRPGPAQGGDDVRVSRGLVAGEQRRAVAGREVGGVDHVLDPGDQPVQRPGDPVVELLGPVPRAGLVDQAEGADRRVELGDLAQAVRHDAAHRDRAGGDRGDRLGPGPHGAGVGCGAHLVPPSGGGPVEGRPASRPRM
jgi:hypothetical protein